MARLYPRFIFSDPQNTKSPGPFIVHLLDPVVVFKLTGTRRNPQLEVLKYPIGTDITEISGAAIKWVRHQEEALSTLPA
jgi:hypothetical protein